MGFFGWLTLALIVLKLMGIVTFGWFWVLGAISIPVTIMIVVWGFTATGAWLAK